MPSTVALYTGLSGLNANSQYIEVTGNNIANVNTTAYKSSRIAFESQFSRTLSMGREPNGDFGGSNPFQVGYGVQVAGTQRNFTTGTLGPTGDQRDIAIDGKGFFIVNRNGQQLYTRDGGFRPNAENILTTIGGEVLMGYDVDAGFNIQDGALVPIQIPIGSLTIAEPTTITRFSGNLNATGTLPTRGAQVDIMGTATNGLTTISTATVPPAGSNLISASGLLTELEDPLSPGSDTPLFAAGQSIELRGAEKGDGSIIDTATLDITSTTTLQNLMDFINQSLSLQSTGTTNPNGSTPGVSINATTGTITINGNTGTVNDLNIEPTDLRLLDSAGALVSSPFAVTKTAAADGESIRTSFVVFDSLGAPLTVDLTMALDSRGTSGTTWRYFVESPDSTDPTAALATGTISFDTTGRLSSLTPVQITLPRTGSGAASPLQFNLEFASDNDAVTALSDVDSLIGATFRDGAPIGDMTDFSIGADGIIIGAFTNGLTRTIGQIPLATFTNEAALLDLGSNLFNGGPNTGNLVVAKPGEFGTGRMVGGALEQSNVDLGQEFINLILASTGYSASSRVIQTTDELLQQLLVLGR